MHIAIALVLTLKTLLPSKPIWLGRIMYTSFSRKFIMGSPSSLVVTPYALLPGIVISETEPSRNLSMLY